MIFPHRGEDDRVRSVLHFTYDEFILLSLIVFRVQRDKIHICLIFFFRHIHTFAEISVIIVVHLFDDHRDPADLLFLLFDDQIRRGQQIQDHQQDYSAVPADLPFI